MSVVYALLILLSVYWDNKIGKIRLLGVNECDIYPNFYVDLPDKSSVIINDTHKQWPEIP